VVTFSHEHKARGFMLQKSYKKLEKIEIVDFFGRMPLGEDLDILRTYFSGKKINIINIANMDVHDTKWEEEDHLRIYQKEIREAIDSKMLLMDNSSNDFLHHRVGSIRYALGKDTGHIIRTWNGQDLGIVNILWISPHKYNSKSREF